MSEDEQLDTEEAQEFFFDAPAISEEPAPEEPEPKKKKPRKKKRAKKATEKKPTRESLEKEIKEVVEKIKATVKEKGPHHEDVKLLYLRKQKIEDTIRKLKL